MLLHAVLFAAPLTMTLRVRSMAPLLPHTAEHGPHAAQLDILHSAVHGLTTQSLTSATAGQLRPPNAAPPVAIRRRCLNPWPQVAEQALQGPNGEILQSPAHGSRWHVSRTTSAGQLTPPFSAIILTSRFIVRDPTPHVRIHGSPYQPETSQSWGQLVDLQLRFS